MASLLDFIHLHHPYWRSLGRRERMQALHTILPTLRVGVRYARRMLPGGTGETGVPALLDVHASFDSHFTCIRTRAGRTTVYRHAYDRLGFAPDLDLPLVASRGGSLHVLESLVNGRIVPAVMFKSEVEKSASSLHPSLDIFNTNSTVCGVETSRFTEISLTSGPEIKPYEFRVQNSKAFLDLQRSYILTKYKVVDENGTDIVTADEKVHAFAPVNFFGCAQFRQIQVFINGVLVYDNDNFPYRCFLSALLSYSKEYKDTFLRLAGYSTESNPNSATDVEYVKRVKACAKSAHLEVITPLWFEPATQSKALLPYVDLRILCFPSSDEFMVDRRAGDQKYKIKILGMSLLLHELHVHDATVVAFDSLLKQRGSITYSSLGTSVRTFYILGGIKDFPTFKLFANNIPRRVFFTLVDASAYNGNHTNPFVFKNFALQSVRLEAGGEVIPFHDYALDYSKNLYSRAYLALQEALSVAGTGSANGVSPETFASHCCVYAFDTSGADADQFALQRIGETTIRLTFASDTPASGLYGIVLGESITNMVIDSDRNPHVY